MKTFRRYLRIDGKLATPEGYEVEGMLYACGECGVAGVKLWRPYNAFMREDSLRCGRCACAEGEFSYAFASDGLRVDPVDGRTTDQIGWYVPAIPDERPDADNVVPQCFWGYTSVPPEEVAWWKSLPLEKP